MSSAEAKFMSAARLPILSACLPLLLLLLPPVARALEAGVIPFAADPQLPVEIEADALEISRGDGRAIFSGAVRVVQGRLRLKAARMLVSYHEQSSQVRFLRAEGEVQLDGETGQSAQGEWAEYDVSRRVITLGGAVLLSAGGHKLAGEELVIDLAAGQSRLAGGEGRVRGLIRSQQNGAAETGGIGREEK